MAKGFSATGQDMQEVLKNLAYEVNKMKASPREVQVTFMTPNSRDASIQEITQVMQKLSEILPDAEVNFETGHHQYDDICVDLSF